MNIQFLIKNEIVNLCGGVDKISSFGLHFMYKDQHYVYVENKDPHNIRFIIPHMGRLNDKDSVKIKKAVNETNREVKYIKALILENGCISICYDHKLSDNETNLHKIVKHIIKSLDFAANYLKSKID